MSKKQPTNITEECQAAMINNGLVMNGDQVAGAALLAKPVLNVALVEGSLIEGSSIGEDGEEKDPKYELPESIQNHPSYAVLNREHNLTKAMLECLESALENEDLKASDEKIQNFINLFGADKLSEENRTEIISYFEHSIPEGGKEQLEKLIEVGKKHLSEHGPGKFPEGFDIEHAVRRGIGEWHTGQINFVSPDGKPDLIIIAHYLPDADGRATFPINDHPEFVVNGAEVAAMLVDPDSIPIDPVYGEQLFSHIVAHEFGHNLGIIHSNEVAENMPECASDLNLSSMPDILRNIMFKNAEDERSYLVSGVYDRGVADRLNAAVEDLRANSTPQNRPLIGPM
jgi:hypothetical protein